MLSGSAFQAIGPATDKARRPHATTVGLFTRSPWNTTTFNQLQDLFRSIGYSFCHISWDEAPVCFICFPSIIHGIERRWISTQGTVPLGNLKVCSVNILLKCFSCSWQTTVLVLLLTFLFSVTKMWNINALQGRIPCTICRICTSFQDALAIKVSLDLLKGLWSYGGINLTGSGYPQIYSALRGETMH